MNKRKRSDFPAILLFSLMVVLAILMACLPRDGGTGAVAKLYITLGDFELDDIKNSPRDTEFTGNKAVFKAANGSVELSNVVLKGRGNTTWDQPNTASPKSSPHKKPPHSSTWCHQNNSQAIPTFATFQRL